MYGYCKMNVQYLSWTQFTDEQRQGNNAVVVSLTHSWNNYKVSVILLLPSSFKTLQTGWTKNVLISDTFIFLLALGFLTLMRAEIIYNEIQTIKLALPNCESLCQDINQTLMIYEPASTMPYFHHHNKYFKHVVILEF